MLMSRSQGLKRLHEFIKTGLPEYGVQRNNDLGVGHHQQNVSVLSPFLSHRLLVESECIAAALSSYSAQQISKWLDEVIWRIYWHGWMDHHPHVWAEYLLALGRLRNGGNYDQSTYSDAVCGASGIASFDSWVSELKSTGYLHNHARMWFASIWIFTLRLPWQLGAEFFLRHLLDGDSAVNTLSWRWVAGLHTKGKRYLATAENIERCTLGRVKVQEKLASQSEAEAIEHFSPELSPTEISRIPDFGSAQFRQSDSAVLILHPDDLAVEYSELAHANIENIIAIDPECSSMQEQFEPLVRSGLVDAMKDGAARAESHFGRRVMWVKAGDLRPKLTEMQRPLVSLRPSRGIWFDLLAESCAHLDLSFVQRRLDAVLFPYAQKGFFTFRERAWTNPATGLVAPK